MSIRVLSKEESEALSPDAIEIIYRNIHDPYCSMDVVEKTLLQAVVLARVNQCRIDAAAVSFLLEKISECEGLPAFDAENNGRDASNRLC